MKLRNVVAVSKDAINRVFWCVKKGFPIRLAMFDIQFNEIPSSTKFGHPYGITIAKGTILGEDCIFMQNVTIGIRKLFTQDPPAVIGNGVIFGAGCAVIGPVHIGNNCVIGANAVVLNSLPDGCIAAGNPARIIGDVT